jgi:hypothetical protein
MSHEVVIGELSVAKMGVHNVAQGTFVLSSTIMRALLATEREAQLPEISGIHAVKNEPFSFGFRGRGFPYSR